MRLVSLVLVVALGVIAVGASAQAAAKKETIKLLVVQTSDKETAKGFVFKDTDYINGKKVGTDTATCTVVGQTKANCNIVFALKDGTIKAKFALSFSAAKGTGTITGGTGEYAGAKGTFSYKNLNDAGTRTSVTLTLT